MGLEAIHGVGLEGKAGVLQNLLETRKIDPAYFVYVGNDINDLPCFEIAGWAVAVADALPEVPRGPGFVLTKNGGPGRGRGFCGLIFLQKNKERKKKGKRIDEKMIKLYSLLSSLFFLYS